MALEDADAVEHGKRWSKRWIDRARSRFLPNCERFLLVMLLHRRLQQELDDTDRPWSLLQASSGTAHDRGYIGWYIARWKEGRAGDLRDRLG